MTERDEVRTKRNYNGRNRMINNNSFFDMVLGLNFKRILTILALLLLFVFLPIYMFSADPYDFEPGDITQMPSEEKVKGDVEDVDITQAPQIPAFSENLPEKKMENEFPKPAIAQTKSEENTVTQSPEEIKAEAMEYLAENNKQNMSYDELSKAIKREREEKAGAGVEMAGSHADLGNVTANRKTPFDNNFDEKEEVVIPQTNKTSEKLGEAPAKANYSLEEIKKIAAQAKIKNRGIKNNIPVNSKIKEKNKISQAIVIKRPEAINKSTTNPAMVSNNKLIEIKKIADQEKIKNKVVENNAPVNYKVEKKSSQINIIERSAVINKTITRSNVTTGDKKRAEINRITTESNINKNTKNIKKNRVDTIHQGIDREELSVIKSIKQPSAKRESRGGKAITIGSNKNFSPKKATKNTISRSFLTTGLKDKEPIDNIESPIIVNEDGVTKIYYFTEIKNMEGEVLYHYWMWNGQIEFEKEIKIWGNRWRASTIKKIPYSKIGQWQARVVNEEGDVLNEIKFDVVHE